MWRPILLAALISGPAMAQTAPVISLPATDVQIVIQGYLYPQKTQPGDVMAAISRINACAAMQPSPGVTRDTGQCPEVASTLKAPEPPAKK